MSQLSDPALDLIFRQARSRNGWSAQDVPQALIEQVYDLMKMGPTSANCSPARILFLHSPAAKARLEPLLLEGNRRKTMGAPWIAIIAWDEDFHDRVPELFPHNPGAKDWFAAPEARFETGFRNSTLQGAYLMIAARAMGLDCGPMSGFDKAGVEREFFANDPVMARWKVNFICAIGHGTEENLFPRLPRLSFEQACRVI